MWFYEKSDNLVSWFFTLSLGRFFAGTQMLEQKVIKVLWCANLQTKTETFLDWYIQAISNARCNKVDRKYGLVNSFANCPKCNLKYHSLYKKRFLLHLTIYSLLKAISVNSAYQEISQQKSPRTLASCSSMHSSNIPEYLHNWFFQSAPLWSHYFSQCAKHLSQKILKSKTIKTQNPYFTQWNLVFHLSELFPTEEQILLNSTS